MSRTSREPAVKKERNRATRDRAGRDRVGRDRVGRDSASVFAALGDETRLALLAKLSEGRRLSIAHLTRGSTLTRQGITKHLRVLKRARLVRGIRQGRERLFELEPKRLEEARRALDRIARQ